MLLQGVSKALAYNNHRENWPQRESGLPLQPRMLVAAKSAEVPAMVIEVAAVAASRGFDQILITILLSRPPLLSGMPLVVAEAEEPPIPSPASVIPGKMLSVCFSRSSGDIG